MRKPSLSRLADAACGAMYLLVALYGAFIVVLMCESVVSPAAFALLGAGLFTLCLLLSKFFGKAGFDLPETPDAFDARAFLMAAGFSLLVSLVYLFAFFPGGFSSDTITQWHQISGTMPLNDWHPALHTMLLWLCTRLVSHPAFVVLVQSVFYACAVGYAAAALRSWRVKTPAIALTTLYLSANPALSNIMTFPWKDCALAVAVLFLSVQLFQIHCSKGAWLKKACRPLLLALTLVLCAILRHNGVALSLAAGVWLLISVPGAKKRALFAAACAAALFALIKGPLYSAAGVQKDATATDETIGLPMVILSEVYVRAPESLDEETTVFLSLLGPQETYADNYVTGDWNSAKWSLAPLPKDHGYSTIDVFGFAAKAAFAEPELALNALSGLFSMPLLPAGEAAWRMSPYVDAQAAQFGIEKAHQPFLSRALNFLCRLTAGAALSWLFWKPGLPLLLVMIACVCFARRRPLTALLLPAALIAHHLATALMLSSPTDFRFFLPTLIGAPLALTALYVRPGTHTH